jgi:site-specific DNA-methyltransferase (adenine-specific)
MATLPDKAFDLAIVDPPYGNNLSGGRSAKNGWNPNIDWDKCNKGWNINIPHQSYFDEVRRISCHQIIWGGNYFANMLPNSECWIIWDKGQRDFSLADGELAWASFDKAVRIKTLYRAIANQELKIHPTQKPVKLYEWLLTNYAKPGQRILDTHLGSGSSAIAAHYFGVDFVGCELDVDYYNAAVKRFNEATKQQALF